MQKKQDSIPTREELDALAARYLRAKEKADNLGAFREALDKAHPPEKGITHVLEAPEDTAD